MNLVFWFLLLHPNVSLHPKLSAAHLPCFSILRRKPQFIIRFHFLHVNKKSLENRINKGFLLFANL